MNDKQEAALRQAREALERHAELGLLAGATITAINEALADNALDKMADNARALGLDYEPPCKTGSQCTNKCQQCEQPAQQQEPVAWVCYGATVNHHDIDFDQNEIDAIPLGTMLYTSPQPSKPWVGLTEEERLALAMHENFGSVTDYAEAIEAKLKEKNA